MSGVRIAIDPDVCVGIGMCELLYPAVVAVGADQVAHARGGGHLTVAAATALRDGCPSGAISFVDDGDD